MTLTDKQIDEMLEKAKPLYEWIQENLHPHCKVMLEIGHIEIFEEICGSPMKVKD